MSTVVGVAGSDTGDASGDLRRAICAPPEPSQLCLAYDPVSHCTRLAPILGVVVLDKDGTELNVDTNMRVDWLAGPGTTEGLARVTIDGRTATRWVSIQIPREAAKKYAEVESWRRT